MLRTIRNLGRRQLGRVRLDPLGGQLNAGAPPVQLRVELPFLNRLNAQLLAAQTARSSSVQAQREPRRHSAKHKMARPSECASCCRSPA